MNLTIISISTRVCTETEAQALSLWSASLLPLCRIWVAQRGIQPPPDVIEALQKVRFEEPSVPEMMLQPLITVPSNNGLNESHAEYDEKLEGIATDLWHDLRQLQMLINSHDHQESFLTASRDLRRLQRAMSQLHLTRLEVTTSKLTLVTVFSPQRMTLYIPRWLIDTISRTMFEPNQSFYRARSASLAWLLLDAIVVTTTNEFKMV